MTTIRLEAPLDKSPTERAPFASPCSIPAKITGFRPFSYPAQPRAARFASPMKSADIRNAFLSFFEGHGHTVVASSPLVPVERPDAALHQLRHGAVQGRLPRAGQASLHPRGELPALPARRRQAQRSRERRLHGAPSHVLRDARQLQLRRLLQARRDPVRLGAAHRRSEDLPPEKLWTTVYADDDEAYDIWTNEDRRAGGACVRIGDNPGASRTTSGRWPTPGPAVRAPRSSTTTDRRSPAARRDRRTRTATATSRSGTSSSCSSTATRRARCIRCRSPRWTPAWASSASPRCCRACTRTTRSISSRT